MTASAREKRAKGDREELVIIDPATLEELDRVPLMTPDEIEKTVLKADRAFPMWRDVPVKERAKYVLRARDYLLEHVDEVAETITHEMGKPRVESLVSEVMIAADLMGYYANRAEEVLAEQSIPIHLFKVVRQSSIRYEPIGVVSVISPWNYPFSIHMSSIVFALLAGNTVVFKAASDATLIAKKIDEIFSVGAGLPEGVLNLVVATGSSMGNALYAPPVRKVAFTGSTATGTTIMREAAKHLIPVTLELGGKDAMIVLHDADLERAAAGAVWGAFSNCGQTCASVERCYVHRSVYDRFVDLVTEQVQRLRVGEGSDPDVDMGPLVNEKQLALVEAHVADAVARGARVVTGGRRPEHLKGFFYEPTVLVNVNHDMRCIREETFGPTLPIMPFDTEDEALRIANDTVYGLTNYVQSSHPERLKRLARRLRSGMVQMNGKGRGQAAPFGGIKHSGNGREGGMFGLEEFIEVKSVGGWPE